jgi:putative N6-adenine-specific DNA methylase
MIMLSGWNADSVLIDPMCGSGTIPIEAAMLAAKIPPAKNRASFAFQRWKNYDKALFEKVKSKHDGDITVPGIKILGYDVSEHAVNQAAANAVFAGVQNIVEIRTNDLKELSAPAEGGLLIINPPYGERLLQGETDSVYSMIGTALKHNFPGYEAWIITSNKESVKHIGLKPVRKYILYNGALECTYLKYELYKGSRKGSGRLDQPK